MNIDELWNEYQEEKSVEHRNKLVLAYLPIVKKIVNQELHGSANFHLREEYLSYGIFGLMDAVSKYDCLKNVKFETYASIRIKGSIKDYIRRQDWLPRGIRDKQKKIEKAREAFMQKYGREPSDNELAEKVGLTKKKYFDTLEKVTYANIVSFEEAISKGIYPSSRATAPGLETLVEKKELQLLLSREIEKLSEKEQLVISLYYRDELKLKEIGKVLKVSESRVSQIIRKALNKLKAGLHDYIEQDAL